MEYFSVKNEIGFILGIVGVQFATVLRNIFPAINLVQFTMILSILLVTNFRNLKKFQFPSFSIILGLFIYLQLYMLFVNCCSLINVKYVLYQSYVICFILAISTQSKFKHFRYFDKILFFVVMLISIVVVYQGTGGFTSFNMYSEYFYKGDIEENGLEQGGDKITLGRALGLGVILALCGDLSMMPILKIFQIFLSLVGLILFSTRAVLLMCPIYFIIKFFYYDKRNILYFMTSFKLFVLTLLCIFSIFYFLGDFFYPIIESIYKAIGTMLWGNTSLGGDISAEGRFNTIAKTIECFYSANLFELIWGQGHYFYVDVPILQAFHDFGLIGGGLYFYLMILLPFQLVFKLHDIGENQIQILQLFVLQYMADQFYCGEPYYFFHFMPIVLLCFVVSNQKMGEYANE